MSAVRIEIEKDSPRSQILGEKIAVIVDTRSAGEYLSLIRRVWPKTRLTEKLVND